MIDRNVTVEIPVRGAVLRGDLCVPAEVLGTVVFAHGSGSGRTSERNRTVASALAGAAMATLLFDLLTDEEQQAERHTRHLRFDIPFLSQRLIAAIDWVSATLRDAPVGLFGASTGAAAALVAAAARPAIAAVVSRGGRPDLAGPALRSARAPALLIVGSEDADVLTLNRMAMRQLPSPKLVVVPGAGHLFEEPGALERVAALATAWFQQYLAAPRARPAPASRTTFAPAR